MPPENDDNDNKDAGNPDYDNEAPEIPNYENKEEPTFHLKVDKDQDYKATELKLCSFRRPHMRAFHYSWWSFFIAFFVWFAIAPLLPEIKSTLDLTDQQIWTTNIVAVAGDIFMRFVFGSLCDKYGARIPMGGVLMFASIPVALTGTVTSLAGLCVLRLFIGVAGSCFVMCQCWSTRMFAKELVGTANALVGGWGNVGGGVTQIVMGTLLFPLFEWIYDGDSAKAWRTVCVVPAVVAFSTGVLVICTSEDCPLGNYKDLKKSGEMPEVSAAASFRRGATDFNTWLLYIQYGCCFGVELTMNNAAVSYFVDTFQLDTPAASAIASVFGFMNIFARGIGGFMSDKASARIGMRGRILVQMVFLFLEGICIFIFAVMETLWAAILLLTIFSIFVQAAEGSTYGIVPYVNPKASGAVSGIVGAGGPSGAVLFGLGFRQLISNPKHPYFLMAGVVIFSGLLSFVLVIKGHRGLLFGKDDSNQNDKIASTLTVPAPDNNQEEADAEAATANANN